MSWDARPRRTGRHAIDRFEMRVKHELFLQGDADIANQPGAGFRADLNNELKAVVTLYSGATAPATTYAYMMWADTTTQLLKQRNSGNSGWIIRRSLSESRVVSKSANFTVSVGDFGQVFKCSNSITISIDAAATLGDGFMFWLRNTGTGQVLIDPNGTEQVDAATSLSLSPGDACAVFCDGAALYTIGRSSAGVPVGSVVHVHSRSAPTGYLKANGATVSRSTYSALFAALVQSSTVTMTIASPCVITWSSHPLGPNDPVKLSTTGALPTGLTAGTTYYVVGASITTNTFQVSASPGGTAINTSGSQSGVHTAICAPYGDGDGSTTFNLPDLRGEFLRGFDDGRGVNTNRSNGSLELDALQGHGHDMACTDSSGSVGGSDVQRFNGTSSNLVGYVRNMRSDTAGGYGTVRATTETRPRNLAMLACIKY